MAYAMLTYKVWASMKDIHFFVNVNKEAIAVMGEKNAVEYEIWKHLFNKREFVDEKRKKKWRFDNPTAKYLRKTAAIMSACSRQTFEESANGLRLEIMDNIHFECVTIDGRA